MGDVIAIGRPAAAPQKLDGFVLLTHKRVFRIAAELFECPASDFSSKKRYLECVRRRQAVVLALRWFGMSYSEVGRVLKKHHTSIPNLERGGSADPMVRAAADVIVARTMEA